jgi:hypothetical protein
VTKLRRPIFLEGIFGITQLKFVLCEILRTFLVFFTAVFGIAPNTPFMNVSGNLVRCGECYEITSNNGSAIFTVVSSCPDCETYYPHFDIRGSTPFNTIIFGNGVGSALVEFKKVSIF